jgi:hypothetical protein
MDTTAGSVCRLELRSTFVVSGQRGVESRSQTERIVGAVFTNREIGRVDMSERAAPEAGGESGLPGSTYLGKAKPWKSARLLASSMLPSTPRLTACSASHVLANDSAELV